MSETFTTLRAVAWMKDDPAGAEFADITLGPRRLKAVGVAVGSAPAPYRLDYRLETYAGFTTSRLRCVSSGEGWTRIIDVRRTKDGVWSAVTRSQGLAPFSSRTDLPEGLDGALDCDLGFSPLTNSLPVLRAGLMAPRGPVELRAAWVSVPDLRVTLELQRYTFVHSGRDGTVIRFESADGSFSADITFDSDGIVLDYPGIAHRVR